MKVNSEARRFALLLAANDSDYVSKVYGGYFNVFVAAFGDEGDIWDLYRVIDGEFPAAGDLEKYDGFVVSGSPHDAYGDDLWILKLCLLLQTLDAMRKRVLGICFGHQVLCRALGGRVAKAYNGWDIGVREVVITMDSFPRRYITDLHVDSISLTASIIECHQDEVWEIPVEAEVIGFSEKTGVEMFAIGDHILGIQGHPEYTKDILSNLIDRLTNNSSISKDFAEEAKLRLETAQPDMEFWEKMCKAFLKG